VDEASVSVLLLLVALYGARRGLEGHGQQLLKSVEETAEIR